MIPQVRRNHSGHYRCFDEANPDEASSIHLLVRPQLAWPGYRARHVVYTGAPSPLIDARDAEGPSQLFCEWRVDGTFISAARANRSNSIETRAS